MDVMELNSCQVAFRPWLESSQTPGAKQHSNICVTCGGKRVAVMPPGPGCALLGDVLEHPLPFNQQVDRRAYPWCPPQPTWGSSEGAPFTRGWELMVRKPRWFRLVSWGWIWCVSVMMVLISLHGSRSTSPAPHALLEDWCWSRLVAYWV